MKEFRLVADFKFFAEDIDDAMERVGEHFRMIASEDEEEDVAFFLGQCEIKPAADYEDGS